MTIRQVTYTLDSSRKAKRMEKEGYMMQRRTRYTKESLRMTDEVVLGLYITEMVRL